MCTGMSVIEIPWVMRYAFPQPIFSGLLTDLKRSSATATRGVRTFKIDDETESKTFLHVNK